MLWQRLSVKLFVFAGLATQEETRLSQIIRALTPHPNHLVAAPVCSDPPLTTFDQLRTRLASLPYEPKISSNGTRVMATALFTRTSPTVPADASAKIADLECRVTFLKKVAAFTRDVARKHGAQEPEFKMPLHSPPPFGSIPQASGSGPGGHKRRGPHQRAAAANLAAILPRPIKPLKHLYLML